MAEHMLILGVEDPKGEKTYVAAAFPSACGKTNFAMLIPPKGFDGWKVWTVGDDIAWIKPDENGRLRAINPEAGFFGVAPGTSVKTNPQRDGDAGEQHDFHQRGADAGRRRVVGRHDGRAAGRVPGLAGETVDAADRKGDRGQGGASELALHGAGFAVSDHRSGLGRSARRADQRDYLRRPAGHDHAAGVPGVQLERGSLHRRDDGIGDHGGGDRRRSGKVRRDPMAMLPFCGYHMGDYFRHWIKMQRSLSETPRIFHVNWFRKDANGKFLWPGFSENMRVLKWIVDRARGRALGRKRRSAGCRATRTSNGTGWTSPSEQFDELQTFDRDGVANGSDGARRAVHQAARPSAAGDDLRARTADLPAVV